jgi:ABC-type transporter Mla MlaB component
MPTRTTTATIKKTPVARKKSTLKKKAALKKSAAIKTSTSAVSSNQVSIQTLTLDSVVVINNAESLYQEFNQVSNDTDINIDASAVEMIDTAVLQLLYAFVMKVQSSDHTVNWIKPSKEFLNRANLLGLSQHIGIS